MKTTHLLAAVTAAALGGAAADEKTATPAPQPVSVSTAEAAAALPDDTVAVTVPHISCLARGEAHTLARIIDALADKPQITSLSFRIPNSSRFPAAALDRLKDYPKLTDLHIRDNRDYPSPEVFRQVAASKTVRNLSMEFG